MTADTTSMRRQGWEPGAGSLHAWREADFATVAGVLRTAHTAWQSAWGLAVGSREQVACQAMDWQAPLPPWQPLGTAAAAAAWIWCSPSAQGQWDALFGSGAGLSALARSAAAACRDDLLARLAAALRIEGSREPHPLPAPNAWSGAVLAVFTGGSRILLNAECVAPLLPRRVVPAARPRAALVPLLQAARRRKVEVHAQLEGCSLDVAALQGLRKGDVVRLSHPLDRPLTVRDDRGTSLFSGFLARSGGCKAVELAPAGGTKANEVSS